METLVTTEGTRLEHGRLFSRIMITTARQGRRRDGSANHGKLRDRRSGSLAQGCRDPGRGRESRQELAGPAASLRRPIRSSVRRFLSGRAAGVFFHEIFGHRIEGHRQKDEAEGQTFTKSVEQQILPPFLSVVFDPTLREFQGTMLTVRIYTMTKA